jgi:DNA-binding transcriptional ArsR family regulator
MLTATVSSPSVPVCSRRIGAGMRPAPGATSRHPAWWGAEDWVEVEVRGAVDARRDLCRARHVDPDTVVAVARGMARFADFRTGRGCRPTNARLVALLRLSLSTVQRARRVLKDLGLIIELIRGRSIMTRAERLAAWAHGSAHRRVAAEFALCSRRRRPRRPQRRRPAVERDTPPGASPQPTSVTRSNTPRRATPEPRRGATRPAATPHGPPRGHPPAQAATRRLAEATRARLRWLSGVPIPRLAPPLHRFAAAGWTPRDVERALDDALAARGWHLPRHIHHPAAYLATLLRPLDPADRPGALDEWRADRERAQRTYERQLIYGPPCPHGQPAGNLPSPLRGHLACPACRTQASR